MGHIKARVTMKAINPTNNPRLVRQSTVQEITYIVLKKICGLVENTDQESEDILFLVFLLTGDITCGQSLIPAPHLPHGASRQPW